MMTTEEFAKMFDAHMRNTPRGGIVRLLVPYMEHHESLVLLHGVLQSVGEEYLYLSQTFGGVAIIAAPYPTGDWKFANA